MNKKLIIGTANFGMNYGISVNQKKLLDKDIIDFNKYTFKGNFEQTDGMTDNCFINKTYSSQL